MSIGLPGVPEGEASPGSRLPFLTEEENGSSENRKDNPLQFGRPVPGTEECVILMASCRP